MFYSKVHISDHTDIRSEVGNMYKSNFFQNIQQDILRVKTRDNIMNKSFPNQIKFIEIILIRETAN